MTRSRRDADEDDDDTAPTTPRDADAGHESTSPLVEPAPESRSRRATRILLHTAAASHHSQPLSWRSHWSATLRRRLLLAVATARCSEGTIAGVAVAVIGVVVAALAAVHRRTRLLGSIAVLWALTRLRRLPPSIASVVPRLPTIILNVMPNLTISSRARIRAALERCIYSDRTDAEGSVGKLADVIANVGDRIATRHAVECLALAAQLARADILGVLLAATSFRAAINEPASSQFLELTPLAVAIRAGHSNMDTILVLLAHGADPAVTDPCNHYSALDWAAYWNHADVVRTLLPHAQCPKLTAHALSVALHNYSDSAAIALIEDGAAILDLNDPSVITSSETSAGSELLGMASIKVSRRLFSKLHDRSLPNAIPWVRGLTERPLPHAINILHTIIPFITSSLSPLGTQLRPGRSLLHDLMRAPSDTPYLFAVIKDLIRGGLDINHFHKGKTALMVALERGYDAHVELLITLGADVNLYTRSRRRDSLTSSSTASEEDEDDPHPPSSAVGVPDLKHMTHLATSPRTLSLILAAGADPAPRTTHSRQTPLHLALHRHAESTFDSEEDLLSIARMLTGERAGDLSFQTAQNEAGKTALHVAVSLGCRDVVQLLLERGASTTVLDKDGSPPREYDGKETWSPPSLARICCALLRKRRRVVVGAPHHVVERVFEDVVGSKDEDPEDPDDGLDGEEGKADISTPEVEVGLVRALHAQRPTTVRSTQVENESDEEEEEDSDDDEDVNEHMDRLPVFVTVPVPNHATTVPVRPVPSSRNSPGRPSFKRGANMATSPLRRRMLAVRSQSSSVAVKPAGDDGSEGGWLGVSPEMESFSFRFEHVVVATP